MPDTPTPNIPLSREPQKGNSPDVPQHVARVLEMMIDAFVALDAGDYYVYVNHQAEHLLGRSRKEILGRSVWDLFPSAVDTPFHAALLQARAEGRPVTCENFAATLGLWLENKIYPSPDGLLFVFFCDVTARKRAEEERDALLRLAQRRAQERESVIEQMPAAVYIGNGEGITSCNTLAVQMLGFESPEEMRQAVPTLAGLIQTRNADTGEMLTLDQEPFIRALHGETCSEEVRVRNLQTGVEMVVRCQAAPLREGDRIVAAIAINTDITALRQGEEQNRVSAEALRRSEARLRAAVDALDKGFVIQGEDGAILFCNGSAERILGLAADQMQGRTTLDPRWRAVREDGTDFPGEQHPSAAALREGLPQRDVAMGVHKPGGELTWIQVSAMPLLPTAQEKAQGRERAHGVVVTFADITERRRAEATLRAGSLVLWESQVRLAEAQRVAQIGSWGYDIASGRLTWSEEMFRLFERDPASGEPSPADLLAHYHPDDIAMHREVTGRTMVDGEPHEFDIRIVRRDGSVWWAHAVGRGERDGFGHVVRLFGTLMDIHERKLAEEHFQDQAVILELQKAQLEAANADLAALATTDGLTGLKNHRSFQERLGEEVERAVRYGTPRAYPYWHQDGFDRNPGPIG